MRVRKEIGHLLGKVTFQMRWNGKGIAQKRKMKRRRIGNLSKTIQVNLYGEPAKEKPRCSGEDCDTCPKWPCPNSPEETAPNQCVNSLTVWRTSKRW